MYMNIECYDWEKIFGQIPRMFLALCINVAYNDPWDWV